MIGIRIIYLLCIVFILAIQPLTMWFSIVSSSEIISLGFIWAIFVPLMLFVMVIFSLGINKLFLKLKGTKVFISSDIYIPLIIGVVMLITYLGLFGKIQGKIVKIDIASLFIVLIYVLYQIIKLFKDRIFKN